VDPAEEGETAAAGQGSACGFQIHGKKEETQVLIISPLYTDYPHNLCTVAYFSSCDPMPHPLHSCHFEAMYVPSDSAAPLVRALSIARRFSTPSPPLPSQLQDRKPHELNFIRLIFQTGRLSRRRQNETQALGTLLPAASGSIWQHLVTSGRPLRRCSSLTNLATCTPLDMDTPGPPIPFSSWA